jgi:hypothetical protein
MTNVSTDPSTVQVLIYAFPTDVFEGMTKPANAQIKGKKTKTVNKLEFKSTIDQIPRCCCKPKK